MKKQSVIICLLLLVASELYSQTVSSVIGASYSEYTYKRVSLQNTALFDSEEIKKRNISTCYVLSPGQNQATGKIMMDTLHVFYFDRAGRMIQEIRSIPWDKTKKDTIDGINPERKFYSRIDSSILIEPAQRIVTKYYVWPFDPQTAIDDTSYIKKFVYDEKGRLVHFKMNGTEDYFKITFCGTGITFDENMRYDTKNRVVFYQDIRSREYARFRYQKNGCFINVYDSLSHQLKRKAVVHTFITGDYITEKNDWNIVTMIRLSKGSKLFNKISRKDRDDDFPSDEFFLEYDYFNDPVIPADIITLKTKD